MLPIVWESKNNKFAQIDCSYEPLQLFLWLNVWSCDHEQNTSTRSAIQIFAERPDGNGYTNLMMQIIYFLLYDPQGRTFIEMLDKKSTMRD